MGDRGVPPPLPFLLLCSSRGSGAGPGPHPRSSVVWSFSYSARIPLVVSCASGGWGRATCMWLSLPQASGVHESAPTTGGSPEASTASHWSPKLRHPPRFSLPSVLLLSIFFHLVIGGLRQRPQGHGWFSGVLSSDELSSLWQHLSNLPSPFWAPAPESMPRPEHLCLGVPHPLLQFEASRLSPSLKLRLLLSLLYFPTFGAPQCCGVIPRGPGPASPQLALQP